VGSGRVTAISSHVAVRHDNDGQIRLDSFSCQALRTNFERILSLWKSNYKSVIYVAYISFFIILAQYMKASYGGGGWGSLSRARDCVAVLVVGTGGTRYSA
jgi:hypothetical protein